MTNFIPIFPLPLVVYPGEPLNLHIFEPRYKQLISEIAENKKPFGIPSVINNRMEEMGTLVRLLEICKTHEDGTLDIKTEGVSVFKILEVVKDLPEKMYSGAIVHYPENITQGSPKLMRQVLSGIREMHRQLKVTKEFQKSDDQLSSYDVAHHVGFSPEDEYQVLQLLQEVQRQEFLKRHLTRVLPVLEQMEKLKKRIKLNGHFKEVGGFNFG
ncbi:MAG: LON peptidase substrate-binding domain-containing protein [Ferruginibacter sp.]|nr:LON peptidase substrate-binding domain-containing protein [Bacteroidota bacterium]MCW5918013.1 LON peptidase substrate-binding domain-containing protein [Ferruginibacter sp.]